MKSYRTLMYSLLFVWMLMWTSNIFVCIQLSRKIEAESETNRKEFARRTIWIKGIESRIDASVKKGD